jgi:hypothetical protein
VSDAPAPAFYVPAGRSFAATELTRGPWDHDSQHAGPPCALLGRAVDGVGGIGQARMARITFEILRPELIEGALSHEGVDLIRARAWRIRTAEVALDEPPPAEEPPAGPAAAEVLDFFPVAWEQGYHTAMEVRFLSGSYIRPGRARAWMRMLVPLVEGEEPSSLDRVLVAADAGNGVSSPLDYRRYVFINTDLSVALRRLPEGEWVCLDSVSYAEPDGVGLSDTTLLDERGLVGRATQSLLIRER